MLESVVENYFKKEINAHGGLALKFVSPSMRGVPDQIVLYRGLTYYVEMKAPRKKPRKSQISVHALFNEYDVYVYTLDTKEKVDSFINDTLKAKRLKKTAETFEIKSNAFDL